MEEKQSGKIHRLQLTNREKGCIQGVRDVNSFDEKEISLVTEAGTLSIKGEGLHVDIEGKVDSLIYSQGITKAKGGEGMLKRLFQ